MPHFLKKFNDKFQNEAPSVAKIVSYMSVSIKEAVLVSLCSLGFDSLLKTILFSDIDKVGSISD